MPAVTTLPLRWPTLTVAVLASGPSMSPAIAEKVRAAGIPTLVTNRTFELAPWADVLVGNDVAWWQATPSALWFTGIKVCLQDCPLPGVVTLQGDELHAAKAGGNSGFTAAWLAAKAGAARVLLCGLDMGGTNWHGAHVPPLRCAPASGYAVWIARFEKHAPRGIEIVNCTPGSALRCFPFRDLDEALAGVREREAMCA